VSPCSGQRRRRPPTPAGPWPWKPLLRGWLHLISFEASLVLGTLALARAHGGLRIAALAVFAASVSAMFGTSALYHRGNWAGAWHSRLQRLDHAMIFLLIGRDGDSRLPDRHSRGRPGGRPDHDMGPDAGRGAIRMAWMSAPELVAGGTFVGLGWAAGLALPAVWLHSGAAAGALLLAGGLLYTAGALSYHRRRPKPIHPRSSATRGLPRLRLRRRRVPLHRDSALHYLSPALCRCDTAALAGMTRLGQCSLFVGIDGKLPNVILSVTPHPWRCPPAHRHGLVGQSRQHR